MAQAIANERKRFERDLHDGLGQVQVAISILASVLADQLTEDGHAAAPLAERLRTHSRHALSEMQGIAEGESPVDSTPGGLAAALSTLCAATDGLLPGTSVQARTNAFPDLDLPEATHLYRIAQEAVSNALKHSGATRIEVSLRRAPAQTELGVVDDGRGIGATPRGERAGTGLGGMQRRADQIGAVFTVASPAAGGTRVLCVLPDSAPPDAPHSDPAPTDAPTPHESPDSVSAREAKIDEALDETFPASDPPAWMP